MSWGTELWVSVQTSEIYVQTLRDLQGFLTDLQMLSHMYWII